VARQHDQQQVVAQLFVSQPAKQQQQSKQSGRNKGG
jgi:hypothetical protein